MPSQEEKEVASIFEKIINKEVPAEIIYEDEFLVVIHDINPRAPVHLLIIPKKVYISLHEVKQNDCAKLMPHIINIAQKMAEMFEVENTGYRLLTNVGPNSGQEIAHLHFHLLGGARLGSIG